MSKAPLISLLTLSCLLLSVASAAAVEPAPKTFVADRAGIIDSAAEQRLIGLLQELEQKTGARIVVLTVNSTDGLDIHQFAFERADQWKFGRNRASASVLVVVASKDRKYRIEVGYDWEGILPDGYVGQVGRDYFVPNFQAGRYGPWQARPAWLPPESQPASWSRTGLDPASSARCRQRPERAARAAAPRAQAGRIHRLHPTGGLGSCFPP